MMTIDPYVKLYEFEKATKPHLAMVWRQYQQRDVNFVDKLVHLSRGRQTVSTESDWKALEEVIKYYSQRWPEEWREFERTVEDIRLSRSSGGYSQSKEIKYTASIPARLERMIKIAFPHQQFDKKFIAGLVKRYKIFKVGGEKN